MRVAVRVDSSLVIGTGHVMRCLALARALREEGAEVEFVCREHDGNIIEFIEQEPFKVHRLSVADRQAESDSSPRDYSTWVGAEITRDVEDLIQALTRQTAENVDWLIVDHYGLGASWESRVRLSVQKLLVIDDLANRKHDCDILLDQNLFCDRQKRYHGLVPEHCKTLLGPEYALLRSEFAAAQIRQSPRSGVVGNVLIYFGGVDMSGETLKAMEAVRRSQQKKLKVHVVAGSSNPRGTEIAERCEDYGFTFHFPARDISALMANADLSIGAAGTTSWERCCLGLPTLMISIADNQTEIAREIDRIGAARYLGASGQVSIETIVASLKELADKPQLIEEMSRVGMRLVDGKGTERVAKLMMSHVRKQVRV